MCGLRRRQRRHEQRRWSVNSGGWVGYDDRRGVQYHCYDDVHNYVHDYDDVHNYVHDYDDVHVYVHNDHHNYDDVYNHHHDGS